MAIRVSIVNDDEIVVRGLDTMLRNYSDRVQVVDLNASVPVTANVDVALYDTFGMGQGNGPSVARLVANPRVSKVAVYTWNFHAWLARDTLSKGVSGYLSKSLSAGQLVEALQMIHSGRTVLSPAPGRRPTIGGDWPGREEGLTGREAEVLSLITMGMSNLEIAEHTALSINSIKSYIRSCYRKIGADSRSKAVLWGIAHGLRTDRIRIEGSPAQASANAGLTA